MVASQGTTTSSMNDLRNNVFGGGGDQYNLKSQMEGCSYDRVQIEKAVSPGKIDDGVIEIDVGNPSNALFLDDGRLKNRVINRMETLFNTDDLSTVADLVMICLPPGTNPDDPFWSAYAYFNSEISVYNDEVCNYPHLQMHEIGHNFNLGHASQHAETYGDESGTMGGTEFDDEGRNTLRCYNSAKSWQLGWFAENSQDLGYDVTTNNPWDGKLIGVGNAANPASDESVLLKLANEYYIGYNYAHGFHYGTSEFANRVTVSTCVVRKKSWMGVVLYCACFWAISLISSEADHDLTLFVCFDLVGLG